MQVLLTHNAWEQLQEEGYAAAGYPVVRQLGLFNLKHARALTWVYEVRASVPSEPAGLYLADHYLSCMVSQHQHGTLQRCRGVWGRATHTSQTILLLVRPDPLLAGASVLAQP